ncbi:hypothetical protein ABZ921_10830 [Streptomyces atriruber]|uniref:MFS transporter n=1 Tax=Streptomyces atriruber TaxID=545121 RepID=A0ABV3BJC1_9ACTN
MALDASMMGAALIVGPVLAGWLSLSFPPLVSYAVISTMTVTTGALVIRSPPLPAQRITETMSWLNSSDLAGGVVGAGRHLSSCPCWSWRPPQSVGVP